MSYLNTDFHAQALLPDPAGCLAWRRACLRTGRTVGTNIQVAPGMVAAVALDLACTISEEMGGPVSLAVQARLADIPGLVTKALWAREMAPERIEVVVTGRMLDDAGLSGLLALSSLRDLGVGIALSGFGSGRVSLVPRLPLSSVILSPSCIEHLPGDSGDTLLLHGLFGLARSQGLRVVATGIHTEAQRALLSGMGCEAGEGSLFGTAEPWGGRVTARG